MDNLLLLNKRKRNLNTTTRETEFQLPRKATSKMISTHSSNQQLSTTMISSRWRWVLLHFKQQNKFIQ